MGRATDFSNCYIYHIKSKDGEVCYVGSTSNLNSRKSCHRYRCNNENDKYYHLDIYQYIRDHGGWDLFDIVPIRKIENISNKTELLIAEQQEINKFSNLKNMIGSYRSEEESKEKFNEYKRQHYKENKEQIIEQKRQYRENNKDQICEYKRQYYEKNKDQINEKNRQYREKNREKLNEKLRKKYQQKKQLEASEQ